MLELLLVLTLVTLLLALAIPNWQTYKLRVGRHQAWMTMQTISLHQDLWLAQHGTYFSNLSRAGLSAEDAGYRYQVELTDTGYWIIAVLRADGSQAADLACQQLSLSHDGIRKINDTTIAASSQSCD